MYTYPGRHEETPSETASMGLPNRRAALRANQIVQMPYLNLIDMSLRKQWCPMVVAALALMLASAMSFLA
jgi:hypothetical protein